MRTVNEFNLVADIGGTNARFALVENSSTELIEPGDLVCADYPTIDDAIESYLDKLSIVKLKRAVISVACPIVGDKLKLTNHGWRFSVSEIRSRLGLESLKMLNDFTALALALPFFADDECLQIGSGEKCTGYAKAVIGPGTGLGVSGLVPSGEFWIPLESEGGHVTYGPVTEREAEIIQLILQQRSHISAETLVSGSGLSLIYEVITGLETGVARKVQPAEVTEWATNGQCAIAVETLSIFCEILGTVAGNLALTLGARGGVYLGGGILPQIADFFAESNFRERFEQGGRFSIYLAQIPTFLIQAQYPALIGALVALSQDD